MIHPEIDPTEAWLAAAREAVLWCADTFGEFTSDETWARLDAQGVTKPTDLEPRRLAQVMSALARESKIVRLVNQPARKSVRRERHGGSVNVWGDPRLGADHWDALVVSGHLRALVESFAADHEMDLAEATAHLTYSSRRSRIFLRNSLQALALTLYWSSWQRRLKRSPSTSGR